MQIAGSTALVTGANRGLGRHFAEQLLQRGATVYAASRDIGAIDLPGVIPVQLDVTDPASIRSAAEAARNVSLLVNNAGSATYASVTDGALEDIRREMDTHYFGTLAVTRAFAPQLAAAGSSAVLNVLSVLSWLTGPGFSAYAAAKAAQWSLTNALRLELAAQGTQVTGLHVGYMDTDMVRAIDAPKHDPAVIAALALDGVEAGEPEVIADDLSRDVRAGLAVGVSALYPQLAA
jgi:NAD(P)-dependent dehydrogenase (short-subunit alcohol dehydrogenase family)